MELEFFITNQLQGDRLYVFPTGVPNGCLGGQLPFYQFLFYQLVCNLLVLRMTYGCEMRELARLGMVAMNLLCERYRSPKEWSAIAFL